MIMSRHASVAQLYPYTRISRHNAARGSPTVGWRNCVIIIAYQKRIGGLTLRRGVAGKADDVKHIDRGRRDRKIGRGPGWMQRREGKVSGRVCNTVLGREARMASAHFSCEHWTECSLSAC